MSSNRLETLRSLVNQNPADSRTRYMLAMEMANSGDLESAVKEYEAILAHNAGYVAAYYHAGQALEKLGRLEEARSIYGRGIEACTRTGDLHTREEIQAAVDLLG